MTIRNIYYTKDFYQKLDSADKRKHAAKTLSVFYENKDNLDNIVSLKDTLINKWHVELMTKNGGTVRNGSKKSGNRIQFIIEDNDFYILDFWNHNEQDRLANVKNAWNLSSRCLKCLDEILYDEIIGYLKDGIPIRWDRAPVKYDKEQDEGISECWKKTPIYISGGAGSGKTVELIGIMAQLQYCKEIDSKPSAYFALSSRLCSTSKEDFKRQCSSEGVFLNKNVPIFENFNDYCLRETGKNSDRLIDSTESFRREFYDKHLTRDAKENLRASDISYVDLWQEIRGKIKGHLGEYFSKVQWLNQIHEIKLNTKEFLEKKEKQYEVNPDNPQEFRLTNPTANAMRKLFDECSKESSKERDVIKNDLDYIAKKYFKLTENNLILSKEDYKEYSKKSRFNSKQLENIYKAYSEYAKWCTDYGYFDENDLALSLFSNFYPEKHPFEDRDTLPFGYIFVDEIQDMTQTQLYVIAQLVQEPQNVIFAGDINQTINPTVFREKYLGNLLPTTEDNVTRIQLKHNYRNSKAMKPYLNTLSQLRRRLISAQSIESDTEDINGRENAKSMDSDNNGMFYLQYTEDNLQDMLGDLEKYPNAAIVVPNPEIQERLKNIRDITNIYTVHEIKGLTFDYVFCFNMASAYTEAWGSIAKGKAKEYESTEWYIHESRRYYFNIFYVALTRSAKYLCIMEENMPVLLKDGVNDNFKSVNLYSQNELHTIAEQSFDAWWNVGTSAEKADNERMLNTAVEAFNRCLEFAAPNSEQEKSAQSAKIRCEAELLYKQHETGKAWKHLFSNPYPNKDNDERLLYYTKKLDIAHRELCNYMVNGISKDDLSSISKYLGIICVDDDEFERLFSVLCTRHNFLADIYCEIDNTITEINSKFEGVFENGNG